MNDFGLSWALSEHEQGSIEWLNDRAGRITGSMVKVVRKRLKNGDWSVPAKKYAFKLAFERISKGVLDDTYKNAYMKRGNDLETGARIVHECKDNIFITETGAFLSACGRFGASPDGLIGEDGGAEYKCFLSPDELFPILIEGDISTVQDQVQFNMLATGRIWWEFFLYTPQLENVTAEPFKKYRIERDEEYIAEMLEDLHEFDDLISEYQEIIKQQYSINDDCQLDAKSKAAEFNNRTTTSTQR